MARHPFEGLRLVRIRATMPAMQRKAVQLEAVLECLECGDVSSETRGWKAFVDDESELLVYCAACAEREFGE
jgi:hypothetical protein